MNLQLFFVYMTIALIMFCGCTVSHINFSSFAEMKYKGPVNLKLLFFPLSSASHLQYLLYPFAWKPLPVRL